MMSGIKLRWILFLGFGLWAGTAMADDVPFRLVETKTQPPLPSGMSVYSVRITPSKTVEVRRMQFVCTLHQEFKWRGSDGLEVTRVIEPAVFTHREENIRLTADLDRHVAFRVDLRGEALVLAYGPRTFRSSIPVTITKIRIEGLDADGEILWSTEVPIDKVTKF